MESRLSTEYGVRISDMLGNKNDGRKAMVVFIGNKKESLATTGARYITTQPLDISKGGVISFYLKTGLTRVTRDARRPPKSSRNSKGRLAQNRPEARKALASLLAMAMEKGLCFQLL